MTKEEWVEKLTWISTRREMYNFSWSTGFCVITTLKRSVQHKSGRPGHFQNPTTLDLLKLITWKGPHEWDGNKIASG